MKVRIWRVGGKERHSMAVVIPKAFGEILGLKPKMQLDCRINETKDLVYLKLLEVEEDDK